MPPQTRPTIADVARAAGVSKGLVSFALNGRPGVAPDTRARILAAAADLGRDARFVRVLLRSHGPGPAPGESQGARRGLRGERLRRQTELGR